LALPRNPPASHCHRQTGNASQFTNIRSSGSEKIEIIGQLIGERPARSLPEVNRRVGEIMHVNGHADGHAGITNEIANNFEVSLRQLRSKS
jgi:hypothetical protein